MKTFLVFLLLLISMSVTGQRYAVYLSVQPADLGVGVRADLGYVYGSFSYGNWGVYKQTYIHNHTKVTVGGIIPLKQKDECRYEITAGVNYHKANYPDNIRRSLKSTLSGEGGFAVYIRGISIGARTDVRRWEPCIDFGFNF